MQYNAIQCNTMQYHFGFCCVCSGSNSQVRGGSCTKNFYIGKDKRVIKPMFTKCCDIIRWVATDAASAEIATTMLQRTPVSDDAELLTPNAHTLRDRSRAVTRFLSRPWQKDPYLKETVAVLVKGRESPAQLIHNSKDIRAWYRAEKVARRARMIGGRRVKNLSAAKHRFASFQRPLGRTFAGLREIFGTMQKTCAVRGKSDDAGKAAHTWLQHIDSKRLFAGALMADIADEVIALLRTLDKEKQDVATIYERLPHFLGRVVLLFGPSRACLTREGYTKFFMEDLQTPIIYSFSGGVGKIERPSQGDIDFVFDCISGWLKLLRATILHEFPHFEAAQAWRVFNFVSRGDRTRDDQDTTDLKRLAGICGVDGAAACLQYDVLSVEASRVVKASRCDNVTAVSEVLAYMEGEGLSHTERSRAPTADIRPVAEAYAGFTATTSGVEQTFTKAVRTFKPQQYLATEMYEEACPGGRLPILERTSDFHTRNLRPQKLHTKFD